MMKLAIGCVLGLLATLASSGALGALENELSAREIVDRAIERAEWKDKENFEARFGFRMLNETQKLDKKGQVKEREEHVYENQPIDGAPYWRLVEKNGRPLTEKELEKEREREEKYRKRIAEKSPSDDDEAEMVFDEELISRYDLHREGLEDVRGRPSYVIAFEPKSGPLPTRKKMDRALNKSAGKLWIDKETYEIAQLEFELLDKVGIWWGLLGSIKQMRGRLQQEPIEGHRDVWLPRRFDIYMNGRIFFKSLHLNEKMEWSDFRKLAELAETTGQP